MSDLDGSPTAVPTTRKVTAGGLAASPGRVARADGRGRGRALRRFLPPQHGAWAMLLAPWLAGTILAGFSWLHVPLLLAWLSGYLVSYYAMLAIKTRRPGRVRAQLWVYGMPTVLFGSVVVALRPAVLWYAPAYVLLLAVNVSYAARRDDRAVLNDVVWVVQSCLMVFICATVAGARPAQVVVAFAVLTAYFVGTVLHVKTLIRERGNARYRVASIGYHVLAAVGAAFIGPLQATVFALLAVRAMALPALRLRPAGIGVVEIVASVAVLMATTTG